MKKYLKKLTKKLKNIPPPEEVFNKKALLFSMVLLAFIYNLMFLNYSNSFPEFREVKKRIVTPLEKNIKKLMADHPMEKMAPYISTKDERVAAFLVGIAKKESNWGKYSPKLNGRDCYNYWGYRGQEGDITPSGYTCFKNPRQAVNEVARRIDVLVNESNLDTPEKMVVWKCGWNCDGHSDQSVSKWIADVGYYYRKVYQ